MNRFVVVLLVCLLLLLYVRSPIDLLPDRYGAALPQVAAEVGSVTAPDPELRWRLAQARHAVKAEMAVHLVDVVRRRTDLMLFTPHNGRPWLPALAREMAALLGWSEAQTRAEIAAAEQEIDGMFAWRQETAAGA